MGYYIGLELLTADKGDKLSLLGSLCRNLQDKEWDDIYNGGKHVMRVMVMN